MSILRRIRESVSSLKLSIPYILHKYCNFNYACFSKSLNFGLLCFCTHTTLLSHLNYPVTLKIRHSIIPWITFLLFWVIFFGAADCRAQAETSIRPGIELELGNKYYDAVDFLVRSPWMYDTLYSQNIRPDIAFAVIIPGLIRYSALRDLVETGAMRTMYIQSGRKYSHYSVGRFQMKPSFAELVERNYVRLKLGKEKFLISNTTKARSERARRLESDEWQVRYLAMFFRIMDKRYAHIKWKNDEDKARFYATAFDVGFNRDERTIRRMMTTSRTPVKRYGKKKKEKPAVRAGDIAEWFMINDGHRFRPDIIPADEE